MKSYLPLLLLLGFICQSTLASNQNSTSIIRMGTPTTITFYQFSCFFNPETVSFLTVESSEPHFVNITNVCGSDETLWMLDSHSAFPGFYTLINKKYPNHRLDIWNKAYLNSDQNATGTKLKAKEGLGLWGVEHGNFLSAQNGGATSQTQGETEEWRMLY